MAKFLLVDDHSIIREFLKNMLVSMGHEIVDEAKTGIEAIKKIKDLNPHFVILDVGIPELDGFEVIKRCPSNEELNYIIFSSMPVNNIKEQFSQFSGISIISKQEDVYDIKRMLGSFINKTSLTYNNQQNSSNSENATYNLSSRELLVLKYLSQGYRNKEIANILMISEKTVSTYKKRIMDKLGCSTISSLILFSHRNNIL
ncbi:MULTISPECIES: response regulator transcription factor [Vibrio]|uniref:response regulator transcription factor n=1 Tax=Vibrio TaxID=662 RepID=UPI0009349344|nr:MULTISPECIES: response regulator transcription factor [Vibrio]PXA73450.1 DNA-binding response regulator [Vibrio sp. 11986-1-5]